MKLSDLDLNLLVVLHALFEEGSVTRAARRVGRSQAATSHALRRLRTEFGDGLLVRAGQRLVPTPRGATLVEPVRNLVAQLQTLYEGPARDARRFQRTYRIGAPDGMQIDLTGPLEALVAAEAPGTAVRFVSFPHPCTELLRDGRVDLTISACGAYPAEIERLPLVDDQLVLVARAGHPALEGAVAPRRCLEYGFVDVTPDGNPIPELRAGFAALGVERPIALSTHAFFVAGHLVARSDRLAVLPVRLLALLSSSLQLRLVPWPEPLPPVTWFAAWHRRYHGDPEHAWLRGALSRIAAGWAPTASVLDRERRRAAG